MRKIKPEDLPYELTSEILDILVEMAREFPKQTFDWANISEVLEQRGQLKIVLDRVQALEKLEEQTRRASMSEEEKQKETEQWKKVLEDTEPKFFGNMGEPETPQEFKRKYGHYPPGIGSDGKKLN